MMMKPICYCFSWDLRFPLINYLISCVRPAPRDPQPSPRPRCTTTSSTVRQLASGSSAHQGRSVSTEPRSVRLSFILCHFASPPKTQRRSQAGRRRWCPRAKLSDWRKPSGRRMSFMCRWGQPKLLGRQRSSVCQAWAGRVCVCVCDDSRSSTYQSDWSLCVQANRLLWITKGAVQNSQARPPTVLQQRGGRAERDTRSSPSNHGSRHSCWMKWSFLPSPRLWRLQDGGPSCQMSSRCLGSDVRDVQPVTNSGASESPARPPNYVFRLKCQVVQRPNTHLHDTPTLLRRRDHQVLLTLRRAPAWWMRHFWGWWHFMALS